MIRKQNKIIELDNNTMGIVLEHKDGTESICTIDVEDYDIIKNFRWREHKNKKEKTSYARAHAVVDGKRTSVMMHRLFVVNSNIIDHIDRNGLNNIKSNLRVINATGSRINTEKRNDNTSGFKGVNFHKQSGKWSARIGFENKRRFLGLFEDPILAAREYDRVAVKLHGEFAVLNFENKENNE